VWDAGIKTLRIEQCFLEQLTTIKPLKKIGIAIRTELPNIPHMTSEKRQTSFRARIEPYSARHIVNATGCSLPTAYDWRSGRRAPPAWLQDSILAEIANYHPQVQHTE
jgi:hypothetical protein